MRGKREKVLWQGATLSRQDAPDSPLTGVITHSGKLRRRAQAPDIAQVRC